MSNFNLTLFEVCELLNRSKKSISRYIRRGLLSPKRIKSKQGTLEYRFTKADIEAFKTQEAFRANHARPDGTDETGHKEPVGEVEFIESEEVKGQTDETRQDQPRQDEARETGQHNEVITLLKETTGLLKEQLTKKDEQIKDLGGKIDQLIERDRETNILLKGLQDKVLLLEQPADTNRHIETNGEAVEVEPEDIDQTGQNRPDRTGKVEPEQEKTDKEKSFSDTTTKD